MMNFNYILSILKARSLMFIFVSVLIIINVTCTLYRAYFQTPQIGNLQNQWFLKRQGSTVKDSATLYHQGVADLQSWEKLVSPKRDFTRVLGWLFETASSNSLTVNQVTYKPAPLLNEKMLAYSIGFNVTGRYAGIKSFIADLSRSKEILVIDAIALSNTDNTKELVSLKVQLTTYFRMG